VEVRLERNDSCSKLSGAVRRLIPAILIALAAVAASAAGAKDSTPPVGTWDLATTRATYSGPPAPVRSALTKLIQRRVVFAPACTNNVCVTYATVKNARGQPVKFPLTAKTGITYTGRVVMKTGIRCGGRALRATLTMTATMLRRQQEGDRLTGTTTARAVRGLCVLPFRGWSSAVRRTDFVGVAANG
jgi:hypothetical protein